MTITVNVLSVAELDPNTDPNTDPTTDDARQRLAHHCRLPMPSKFEPLWISKELAYWCVMSEPRMAYHVVLRMPMGFDVAASSPAPGQRTVRLLYDWEDVVRLHLHLTPARLTNDVLRVLAEEGERLRAAIRYARTCRNGGGR